MSVSFNGGKDCTVMLHLIHKVFSYHNKEKGAQINAVYVREENEFPEVVQFIEDCKFKYNLSLTILQGPLKSAFASYLGQNTSIKAVFVGVRRTDPNCENLSPCQDTNNGWPSFLRVHPILDWNYSQIWEYINIHNVPYCPLYNHGYTSIGSTTNTSPNPSLLSHNQYLPASQLNDPSLERASRIK